MNTEITKELNEYIEKTFIELTGIKAEMDGIMELMGFSKEFRKDLFCMTTDLQEMVLINILRSYKEQLKEEVFTTAKEEK